jgi:hypothetical protein
MFACTYDAVVQAIIAFVAVNGVLSGCHFVLMSILLWGICGTGFVCERHEPN